MLWIALDCPCLGFFFFLCFAHRLELALKDAFLSKNYFTTVDELLFRIYYLYEKSPKKCHELNQVVAELKQCLEPGDLPAEGGNRPLRACGTRFVAHKVAALRELLSVLEPKLDT